MTKATPFLMFEGKAEEAMTVYCDTIPGSQVLDITRYSADEDGTEGTLKLARALIGGVEVRIYNSPVHHAFTFTPSFSFFVDCSSQEELEHIIGVLSKDGGFLMPTGDYGFSRRFAWLNDRFGVSWQINLP
jgi:predicted 3-demethylubiquinone-9 3-methyltransferase (glyoxalase superfamily)